MFIRQQSLCPMAAPYCDVKKRIFTFDRCVVHIDLMGSMSAILSVIPYLK